VEVTANVNDPTRGDG